MRLLKRCVILVHGGDGDDDGGARERDTEREKEKKTERMGEEEGKRATRKCACARGISKFTRHLHRSAGYRRCV
jgi:hypothetical protein